MSYVRSAGLHVVDDITEARIAAQISTEDCIELCDISKRTWYRWLKDGAPKWAIRLILSQRCKLDRFGWRDWEVRDGCLYNNQLHHRYYWTPANLLLPLYGIQDSDAPWSRVADNLSSIEQARRVRKAAQATDSPIELPALTKS